MMGISCVACLYFIFAYEQYVSMTLYDALESDGK